jgi:hypothetical protein
MLTPREFAFVRYTDLMPDTTLPDCEVGLLFCEDDQGRHVTAATFDPDCLRLIIAAHKADALGSFEAGPDKFPVRRSGWPDEWNGQAN